MYILMMQLKVKDDRIDDFIAVSTDDAESSVLNEPGCRRFEVIQDTKAPTSFAFYQVFDDEAAFIAHTQSPHFKSAYVAIDEMCDGPKSVSFYKPVYPRGNTD